MEEMCYKYVFLQTLERKSTVKMSCLYIFAAFKHPEAVVKEKRWLGLCPITASVVTRDKFATKTAVHLCKYETCVVKVASILQILQDICWPWELLLS